MPKLRSALSAAFLGVSALTLPFAPAAYADANVHIAASPVEPEPFELTLPAGEVCTFPVSISGTDGQKEHDNQGVIALTGPITATITNLDDPSKVVTLNISGPTLNDGTTAVGPWLILQFASTHPEDHFMILNQGRVEFAPDGTIAESTGHRTDLCAALA